MKSSKRNKITKIKAYSATYPIQFSIIKRTPDRSHRRIKGHWRSVEAREKIRTNRVWRASAHRVTNQKASVRHKETTRYSLRVLSWRISQMASWAADTIAVVALNHSKLTVTQVRANWKSSRPPQMKLFKAITCVGRTIGRFKIRSATTQGHLTVSNSAVSTSSRSSTLASISLS